MTEYVAFFRNVNQGQRGHPSADDLVGALADVGYPEAVAFQSNGTVIFSDAAARHVVRPAPVGHAANVETDLRDALVARTGIERDVFVVPLDAIVGIVGAHSIADDASRCELTLHRGGIIDVDEPSVIQEAARRRCRLIAAGPGWTLAANERDRESNATPVVERITNGPATSRGLPTLIRLVDRFAR